MKNPSTVGLSLALLTAALGALGVAAVLSLEGLPLDEFHADFDAQPATATLARRP